MITFVRNDGQQFKFLENDFTITKLEGIGMLKNNITTEQRAVGDGDIITSTRKGGRIVNIETMEKSITLTSSSRVLLRSFFMRNGATFNVFFNYKNSIGWLKDCVIDTANIPSGDKLTPQVYIMAIYAADPYFRSISDFGVDIAANTKDITWPLISIAEGQDLPAGFHTGVLVQTSETLMPNDGDAPTKPYIVITANGTVEHIRLYKDGSDSGVSVGIDIAISVGDQLYINFEDERVWLTQADGTGSNVTNLVTYDSTFWDIDVGGSVITYHCETGGTDVSITVYYYQLYNAL